MARIGIRIGGKPVTKSFAEKVDGVIEAVLEKARPGLVRQEVEVHRGGKTFKQNRWVRPEEVKQGRSKKAPEQSGEKRKAAPENKKSKRLGIQKPGDKNHIALNDFDKLPYKAAAVFDLGNGKFNVRTNEKNANLKSFSSFDEAVNHAVSLTDGDKSAVFGYKDKKAQPLFKEGEKRLVTWRSPAAGPKPSIGDTITGVDVNGEKVSGTVTAVGADGVTVDGKFHVEHGKAEKQATPKREYIPPDKFSASDYAKQWGDPKATADEKGFEYILDSFGKEGAKIAHKIRETEEKLKFGADDRDTQKKFLLSGKGESARYKEVREKLHGAIMQTLLAPDKIRMAKPDPNQEPAFTILGGRGGSGKSWFKNNVYEPAKCVVLDADEIKAMLPEYHGWNAQDVHEESSDILEQMIGMCIREGLNVVLDATMKTADSAIAKVLRFKSAGYKVEAHYMHLPVQEAAKRAIGRFKGENGDYTGRYVPVDKILKNTTNEDSFDQVRRMVDKWSFRDSNGKKGEQPILISEGKKR